MRGVKNTRCEEILEEPGDEVQKCKKETKTSDRKRLVGARPPRSAVHVRSVYAQLSLMQVARPPGPPVPNSHLYSPPHTKLNSHLLHLSSYLSVYIHSHLRGVRFPMLGLLSVHTSFQHRLTPACHASVLTTLPVIPASHTFEPSFGFQAATQYNT